MTAQNCDKMLHKLVKIPQEDLPKLRDLYKVNWPKNIIGYFTIDNYIRWYQKQSKIDNLNIYSLDCDWTDGTYIIIDRGDIIVNSIIENNERIITALSLLDWSTEYMITAFPREQYTTVHNFIKLKGLKTGTEYQNYSFILPKEEVVKYKIEIPDGLTLKPMLEQHALITDKLWAHRYPGSISYFERLIRFNVNIGAFTKNDELIGWCYRTEYGGLGSLHVIDEYKRRGIGKLLVKAMAKEIANMDQDVTAVVRTNNLVSRSLFESLGFNNLGDVYWLEVKPE